jgi:hypothetical protein
MKKTYMFLLIATICSVTSFGQLKFGADLYSRYVWRGLDFGNSPSIQPSITFAAGGFSAGFWGAYSLTEVSISSDGSKSSYAENDFWASYAVSIENSGSFSAFFTDYYIPSAGIPFGNYKPGNGSGAAHTLEAGIGYTGPEKFPVSLAFYANVSNDPDNSSYIQAAYPFNISDAALTLSLGAVTKKSAYYAAEKGGIIMIGLNAAKSIAITDKFSLPVNVSYINNPSLDVSYLVFGLSFTF